MLISCYDYDAPTDACLILRLAVRPHLECMCSDDVELLDNDLIISGDACFTL